MTTTKSCAAKVTLTMFHCHLAREYLSTEYTVRGPNGWMDELRFNVPSNNISFISGRWKGEHEKLCAIKRRLGSEIISPPAVASAVGLEFNRKTCLANS